MAEFDERSPQQFYDPLSGLPIGLTQAPEQPQLKSLKRQNWFMEPDLQGYQMGHPDLPPGAQLDESGAFYPDTGERLAMVRRPGVLPIAATPDEKGYTFVMPKLADLAGYIMGGSVPLKGAEVALGAGAIRRAAPAVDEVLAARNAAHEKYGLPGTHPDEAALTVNEILHPDTPALPPRSRDVEEIAKALDVRGSDALRRLGVPEGKIEYQTSTPLHDELVSRAMASEIQTAMGRGGKTAADWYTKAIDEAMEHAAAIHPELKGDPLQKMGFTSALAITSQGEAVASNVRLAEQAYDVFKRTGRFPTNIVAKSGPDMNANFAKLNRLLDDLGPEGARDFMHREFTVKELKQLGHDIGKENINTKVYGSSILGPKIGQGFYQNLNGNYNPVTMDLWFMRAMGRLTGTLVGKADITQQVERFQNALRAEGGRVPSDPSELFALADEAVLRHERDFRTNRALYDAGERSKSELTYAAERLAANLRGVNETPTGGGHRQWMRDRVDRARELLKGLGHDLTNADLQAIWWYPEKDLYAKLGGRPSEAINTDYATVYRDLRARRAAGQP